MANSEEYVKKLRKLKAENLGNLVRAKSANVIQLSILTSALA
jgi:hypothetical protein